MPRSFALRLLPAWAGLLLIATSALAQLPAARLNSIFPSGGQQGQSFDVTIAGSDLDDVARLHFSHPRITAVQKADPAGPFDKGPQTVPNQFTVDIAANVPIGPDADRAIGRDGL